MTLVPAVALSLAIALAAWALRALTAGGALAATLVGVAVVHGLGWSGLAMLGAFFVGASAISRLAPDPTSRLEAKGSQRDWAQVLANGGAAAVGAWHPEAGSWIVAGALAAAAADTWATSTGGWSRHWPRGVLTLAPVPPGTNGGVSWAGTAGALLGATTVGAAGVAAGQQAALFPLALGVGMLGMLLDSVLGASMQARFHCDSCDRDTEQRRHRCGSQTRQAGGIRWVTNDVVNGMATAAAALLAWGAWWLLARFPTHAP